MMFLTNDDRRGHLTHQALRRLACGLGGLLAATLLAACGASKPKPTPLESLTPVVKLESVWQHKIGAMGAQLSIVTTADGAVVAAATDGRIQALDIASGKLRWKADADAKLSAAVGSDGRYAAVVTSDNVLKVFDAGHLAWSQRQPGRVATAPLVAGERVFVQAVDRSVRAYDVVDGRWLWVYQHAGTEPLALAARGVIEPFRDTLLVGQGNRLVGLDPDKGEPRFDVSVGTPRGTNEVERLADLIGPLARVDDEVCARSFQFTIACLELNRGSVRWTHPQSGTQAVGADLTMVVGSDGGDRLSAWKAEDGELLWRVDRFIHRGLSAPAIWVGRVVVGDEDGWLHVLARDDGRTLGRVRLDGPLACAPLVVKDELLVATREGTLYAWRLN